MMTLNRTFVFYALALVGFILLPQLIAVKYYLHLSILALIWVIAAQGQNLIQGYTGYVSIVQAGFMGIGAYAASLLLLALLVVLTLWRGRRVRREMETLEQRMRRDG